MLPRLAPDEYVITAACSESCAGARCGWGSWHRVVLSGALMAAANALIVMAMRLGWARPWAPFVVAAHCTKGYRPCAAARVHLAHVEFAAYDPLSGTGLADPAWEGSATFRNLGEII